MLTDLIFFVLTLPILLVSITIHEYSHGRVAEAFGDPTPRVSGRLTLNPLAHIDPLGFLMLIIVRFGWAKPVPINYWALRNPKRDIIWIGLSGPLANFIFAVILSALFRILPHIPLLISIFENLILNIWILIVIEILSFVIIKMRYWREICDTGRRWDERLSACGAGRQDST